MKMTKEVYISIMNTIGTLDKESGGILGGSDIDNVTYYHFDRAGTLDIYIPDIVKLNQVINEWAQSHVRFLGIIHSHFSKSTLSYADVEYARLMLRSNLMERINMPILVIESNTIKNYIVRENSIFSDDIVLLE